MRSRRFVRRLRPVALAVAWVLGPCAAFALCADPPGDLNGDAQANVTDALCSVLSVVASLSGKDEPGCLATGFVGADANCDAQLDVVDVQIVISVVLGLPFAGDFDGDGCHDACATPLAFEDVTDSVGIAATYQPWDAGPGLEGTYAGAAAVADFNGDGWPDIYLGSGGIGPEHLYVNQQGQGFVDVAAQVGLDTPAWALAAAAADYDDDGVVEIFVTTRGVPPDVPAPGHNRLYDLTPDGTFVDVAAQVGVATGSEGAPSDYAAAWGDVDLDGDLDLFVGTWHKGPPTVGGNRLFLNQGDGTFVDATDDVFGPAMLTAWSFTPIFVDFDEDGWTDLLLAADYGSSRVVRQLPQGLFVDVTSDVGATAWVEGMGAAVADFDGDGRLDWFISGIYSAQAPAGAPNGNVLYLQTEPGFFQDRAAEAGVADGGWAWGAAAVDFDNDGWDDLFQVNGFPLSTGLDAQWYGLPPRLWHNRRDGTFLEVAAGAGVAGLTHMATAVVPLDYDRDGRIDLLVVLNGAPARLLRNVTPGAHHWLDVVLETSANPYIPPHGYGARVEVTAQGHTQVRFVHAGQGYLATSEYVLHFGLGEALLAQKVVVRWPRGQVTTLGPVQGDQRIAIHAPSLYDVNADGVVDSADRAEIELLLGPVVDGSHLRADLDNDRTVDQADLDLFDAALAAGAAP